MDFDYTAEENAFREEVRNFISENLPPKKIGIRTFSTLGWKKYGPRDGLAFRGQKNLAAVLAA